MKRRNLVVRTWLGICLTVLTVGAAAEALPAHMAVVALDIKSQPITAALNEFGQQTGIQVLFYSDVADGVKEAPALTGSFTPDEALTRLLSKTGLMYSYINTRTVAIHRAVSDVSEGKARRHAGRPLMKIANVQPEETPKIAYAQQGRAEEQRREASTGEARLNPRMEEVIVTAQKRVENIQDVPISIAVVSAEDIERRGLVNGGDYLRGIPGVNQMEGYLSQAIVIRGIQTSPTSQNFSSGATYATYFGETPTTNSAGLSADSNVDLKLVDVARVEVLRGPQGTAFGDASLGGALRIIPEEPRIDALEGKVTAEYSNTSGTGGDNYNVQMVGNLPLVQDKFAVRAVGYRYQDSGFYQNRAASDPAFQATVVTPQGAQAFAVDDDEVGTYYVLGGRASALWQASDALRFTLGYAWQETETGGIPLANSNTYEQTLLQIAPEQVVRNEPAGFGDTNISIVNPVMEYSFDWADLVLTYSYIDSGSRNAAPWGYMGSNLARSGDSEGDHREHVGELRLATRLNGSWNFLAGVFAQDADDDSLFTYYWFGSAASNPLPPGERGLIGTYIDERNLTQKAVYAEANWTILPSLTLTGGARYYDYKRTVFVDSEGPFFGGSSITTNVASADGVSPRVTLSYKPNEDGLVYASFSQGFRLGKPQPGLPAGLCDVNSDGIVDGTNSTIESTRSLNSDEVDSYEVGGKFTSFDGRLNASAAVFRMDWTGMPFRALAPIQPAGCGLAYNANAGEARSEGVELQANVQLSDALRVDFGGSWIDAKLTEDVTAIGARDGNRLAGSPEINANLGVQYEFAVGAHKAFVRADSIYVGDFYGDLLESPVTKAGDYVKIDATAGVSLGDLTVDLLFRNVTNEDAFTFRGTRTAVGEFYGYRLRPRTIGLRLRYTF